MDTQPDANKQVQLLHDRVEKYLNIVESQLSLFSFLDSSIAAENVQELDKLKGEVAKLRGELDDSGDNPYFKNVLLPHIESSLASSIASVRLADTSVNLDTRQRYMLHMQREQLELKDVEPAIEIYHNLVEELFKLQRQVPPESIPPLPISDVEEYGRFCGKIVYELDRIASGMFGRKVKTPADFDIKEKSHHHFLGQINVGFEHSLPKLVMIIAHEGPFGHNTHDNFSKDPAFQKHYSHTTEGLAVLGCMIALKEYMSDERYKNMVDYMCYDRQMDDALNASFEKLLFHDMVDAEQLAEKLHSKLLSKEYLLKRYKNIACSRDDRFRFDSAPYFAGYRIVSEAYYSNMERLKQKFSGDDIKVPQMQLLNVLYSGLRPARILAVQANLAVDKILNPV